MHTHASGTFNVTMNPQPPYDTAEGVSLGRVSINKQYTGTMTRGKAELTVSVVPDSGAAQLKGIAGQMTIDIVEGQHLYTFEYSLHAAA